MRFISVCMAAAIMATAQPAAAERWFAVGDGDNVSTYVDADSIETRGAMRYARSFSRYAAPLDGDVYAGTIASEFDCANNWFRTLEYSYYGPRREHLATERSETIDQRRPLEPGTINAGIFRFVCFGAGGVAVVDPWVHAAGTFGK